jgi:DNA-binding transcriptional MerR regulator
VTYTIDELAQASGLTVRTTRYYAGLGLLPAPERRGRVAVYSADDLARLGLVRALQEHGFTLSAIERILSRIPTDATAAELGVQRAMLTSWAPPAADLSRAELVERAGRPLSDEMVASLLQAGTVIRSDADTYAVQPGFEAHVAVFDLDIPLDGIAAAGEAVARHTTALAEELDQIFRRQVVAPYRARDHSDDEASSFEETVARLRQLTVEAVIGGFRRAADRVITRSLSG